MATREKVAIVKKAISKVSPSPSLPLSSATWRLADVSFLVRVLAQFRAAIRLRFDFHRAVYNLGTVLVGGVGIAFHNLITLDHMYTIM